MNFSALRHRDFRLFLGGQLVSMIGTWMQSVGQAWLVLELTRSPLSLGLVSALQFLPVHEQDETDTAWDERKKSHVGSNDMLTAIRCDASFAAR